MSNWIKKSETFEFLAKDPETVSCTSICIVPKDEWFVKLDDDTKAKFMKQVCSEIEKKSKRYGQRFMDTIFKRDIIRN